MEEEVEEVEEVDEVKEEEADVAMAFMVPGSGFGSCGEPEKKMAAREEPQGGAAQFSSRA